MKRSLTIAAAFIAITVPATWLWLEWGREAYSAQFLLLASATNDLLGIPESTGGGFRLRYINFVPFVGLLLVTPGLSAARRFAGLVGGLLLLCVSHLVINAIPGQDTGLRPVTLIVSDALPFVLWAWISAAPISALIARFAGPGSLKDTWPRGADSSD